MSLPALRRVRWGVRATLTLGVAASVAANILHARPNPISQAIAAWPPLALLLTVEMISRVPMYRRVLAAARLGATAGIAGIAAWVSYWHMAGVAARYGESPSSAYLLPLSVDGLIIVGSVSLVELAGRIRGIETERQAAAEHAADRAAELAAAALAVAPPAPGAVALEPAAAVGRPEAPVGPGAPGAPGAPEAPGSRGAPDAPAPMGPAPVGPAAVPEARTRPAPAKKAARRAPASTGTKGATQASTPRQRRPAAETAALAEAIEATHPEISRAELARQLGISVSRLATVRRETRQLDRAA